METQRFVIAIDKNGVYIRETICVIHDGDTGEVTYIAKPYDGNIPDTIKEKVLARLRPKNTSEGGMKMVKRPGKSYKKARCAYCKRLITRTKNGSGVFYKHKLITGSGLGLCPGSGLHPIQARENIQETANV